MIKSQLLCWTKLAADLAATLILCSLAMAPVSGLEVGQPAPNFALPDQSGTVHRLADYRGKVVILAFYPKDMTAG